MKILKVTILLFSILLTLNSCQESESIEENLQNEVKFSSRQNNQNHNVELYWDSGSNAAIYLDGVRIGYGCVGVGGCGPFIASLDNGNGVPVIARIEEEQLVIEFLDSHITIDQVFDNVYEGNDAAVDMVYEELYSNALFEEEISFGTEISDLLLGSSGSEVTILPGNYLFSFNDLNTASLRLNVAITDPEKEDKEKTNKNAKN